MRPVHALRDYYRRTLAFRQGHATLRSVHKLSHGGAMSATPNGAAGIGR